MRKRSSSVSQTQPNALVSGKKSRGYPTINRAHEFQLQERLYEILITPELLLYYHSILPA